MCKWNDSSDVDPQAYLYMGSSTPPFFNVPVWVYNWMAGSSTSCMLEMCCFCSSQFCWIDVFFSRGIPMVSFALSEENVSIRSLMRQVVSSTPRVRRLQWLCKASSFLVICIATSCFRFLHTSLEESWPLLAAYNLWRSLVSHSKTHADSRDIKVAYRAWDSEQQPAANRLIKCHTSRCMTRFLHSWKWLFNFVKQQSRSTYRSFGGSTSEFLYLYQVSHHVAKTITFRICQDRWQYQLAKLIAHICGPRSCSSSISSKLFSDLQNCARRKILKTFWKI